MGYNFKCLKTAFYGLTIHPTVWKSKNISGQIVLSRPPWPVFLIYLDRVAQTWNSFYSVPLPTILRKVPSYVSHSKIRHTPRQVDATFPFCFSPILKGHCHHFKHDFGNLKNIYRSLEAEQLRFCFVEQYSTKKPTRKWGWITMARMQTDCDMGDMKECQDVSFSKVQVWLENRWNFTKMLLQFGLSPRNCF